ncbi:hypothetical protein M9Y10_023734 [Tritrichomonas musculus]|uniref:KilA-N domain-containing protein n=1 Tax=Tritrichomonas musculus TaxID=1915356 RepID=A0ABR2KW65_9EUKA
MSIANNNKLVYEPINEDYEWIQYNKQLRIIHSVNDDMYQVQSIINACESTKQATRWINSESKSEIFDEIVKVQKCTYDEIVQNRRNLAPGLRGYYIHRLLVNYVAMWASPKYAVHIFKLLDEIASKERNELTKMVEEKETQIIKQQPRLVPKKKENSYKYLIWKEDQPDDPDMILLHLVKRNCRSFRQVSKHFNNKDERWFYRDNLPIAMTPNEDIKDLVRRTLPGSEYDIDGSTILTYKEHLPILYESITKYFNEFQK